MKKIIPVIGTVLVLSCSKKHDTPAPAATPFLNFNQTAITVTPVPGTVTEVIVESNVDWQPSSTCSSSITSASLFILIDAISCNRKPLLNNILLYPRMKC